MEFLGIKNVVNAEAILGKDGCADGFKVTYTEQRNFRRGGKNFVKTVEKQKTIWVREYVPENDGLIHGFGNPTVYKKTVGKKQTGKKPMKMTAAGLAAVTRILNSK